MEDFVLRFCPAASDPAQVLYEASSKQSDDRVRLRGKVSIDEISKLRRQIVECLQISRKSRRIVLGDRSFLELIFDCQNTGQIDIRVNFWIDDFLMPQMLELKADQTHLQILCDQLDGLMRSV